MDILKNKKKIIFVFQMYLLFYNLNNTDNICVGVYKNKEDAILE